MEQWYLALAQASGPAPAPAQSIWSSMVLMALVFAIFYFLVIRPQQKQAKEHRAMASSLKKGDSIVFANGIYGRIVEVAEKTLIVDIADKVKIKVNRDAVAGRVGLEPQDDQAGKKK